MPRAGEARTEAQKKADATYNEKNRKKINLCQKENFANVSATFKKAEAEAIRATFTEAGIKTADAIRAAAHYLRSGGTIAAGQEPITPTKSAAPEGSPDGNANGANG